MREKRMSKATHRCIEFGQTRGAKHMTGCNKGERQREKTTECEDLEQLSADRRATHCSAERARSECVNMPHASG